MMFTSHHKSQASLANDNRIKLAEYFMSRKFHHETETLNAMEYKVVSKFVKHFDHFVILTPLCDENDIFNGIHLCCKVF